VFSFVFLIIISGLFIIIWLIIIIIIYV
jgi:hypothetical protein